MWEHIDDFVVQHSGLGIAKTLEYSHNACDKQEPDPDRNKRPAARWLLL